MVGGAHRGRAGCYIQIWWEGHTGGGRAAIYRYGGRGTQGEGGLLYTDMVGGAHRARAGCYIQIWCKSRVLPQCQASSPCTNLLSV